VTTFAMVLKILGALFSPEFEAIVEEFKKSRSRELSREIEAAKQAAQDKENPSTRGLQKSLGKLVE